VDLRVSLYVLEKINNFLSLPVFETQKVQRVAYSLYQLSLLTIPTALSETFVCFYGRPRQATDVLQPAGLLYRPIWTFQLWPPDAPAPTDAFRTLAAEVGTYGRE
jgi:hypothetical protein